MRSDNPYHIYDKYFQLYKHYQLPDLDHLITYVIESGQSKSDLDRYVNMLVLGIPLAYITSTQPFCGLELALNSSCLIPRQRTEYLVEAVLDSFSHRKRAHVLDLCCGCGTIGIAIAERKKDWTVELADINPQVIEIAKLNAQSYKLNNVRFTVSKGFDSIYRRYDIIIANPPYLRTIDRIDRSVIFEPHIALFSGLSGLDMTQYILDNAYRYSHWLCLEYSAVNYHHFYEAIANSSYHVVHSTDNTGDARHIILRHA